jgi:hypothetical protein
MFREFGGGLLVEPEDARAVNMRIELDQAGELA